MNAISRTISYLQRKLSDAQSHVRVSSTTPEDRRSHDSLVVVTRSGGAIGRFLDEPRLTIDCYAQTNSRAYGLAMAVADLLAGFPDRDAMVSAVNDISLYRNDWTDGSPCYSISCAMTINR